MATYEVYIKIETKETYSFNDFILKCLLDKTGIKSAKSSIIINQIYKCKGCKEEGRRKGEYLGYLHDTGLNPVSVEQTLRVSSDLK